MQICGNKHANSPLYSLSLGIIIPALIQGSSGSVPVTPFSCSGYGWTSCVKPGYMKAVCWPPRAATGYTELGCIPMRPTWCRAGNADWDRLKRWDLERTSDCAGDEFEEFGWGEEGVSEPPVDSGLSPGLLLWYSPGDALSVSVLWSTSCASSASIRKFLDFSMLAVILTRDVSSEQLMLFRVKRFCCF